MSAGSGSAPLRVHPFGDRAWLVVPAGPASTSWVLDVAERASRRWPAATVVPGLASVLIVRAVGWGVDAPPWGADAAWPPSPSEVAAGLADSPVPAAEAVRSPVWERVPAAAAPTGLAAGQSPGVRVHRIRTAYEGPDLEPLAAALGLGPGELVARHVGIAWTVAAIGFAPGFGYLTCADPIFRQVVRRSDPRARVPAGSVALAAGMCAVYPSATPGGWQLIGSTPAQVWDAGAVPPALLRVGDIVRFEVAR